MRFFEGEPYNSKEPNYNRKDAIAASEPGEERWANYARYIASGNNFDLDMLTDPENDEALVNVIYLTDYANKTKNPEFAFNSDPTPEDGNRWLEFITETIGQRLGDDIDIHLKNVPVIDGSKTDNNDMLSPIFVREWVKEFDIPSLSFPEDFDYVNLAISSSPCPEPNIDKTYKTRTIALQMHPYNTPQNISTYSLVISNLDGVYLEGYIPPRTDNLVPEEGLFFQKKATIDDIHAFQILYEDAGRLRPPMAA